ncbi:MAG: regulatory protein RecX [Deltaproteobacteria bacterium]|nr:regulatory protein RecX [Deltaproteobacteria bacterium]MBZ0218862.1 recombination regulator RecX [Deltaproteobacteria bacterium]
MKEKPERKEGGSQDAVQAAFRLLSVRQRSVRELELKLLQKGFDGDAVGKTIEYLLKAGLLDDERFARSLAESRSRHKAWGPARIARDLASRGLDESAVKSALAGCAPEEDSALEAYRRWLKRNSRETGPRAREKAFRHLRARGFSTAAIMKALGGLPPDE